MPLNPKQLAPALQVGDRLVSVGTLTWGGFKLLLAEFTKADLPLPKLSTESIAAGFADIQALYADAKGGDELSALVANQAANAKLYELLATLAADNLPTITAWIAGHAPLVDVLVREASNLSAEEGDQLSVGQKFRVARAAWAALQDDGFFTEAAGFFGGLVGLKIKQAPPDTSPSKSPAANPSPDPANGAASESASTLQSVA
jgi:hypothetical protein